MWICLKDEYGRLFDFEYIRVNNEFMNLCKDDNTIMNIHISYFNQFLQEVEYNKSITIVLLEFEVINLQFMFSLDLSWEIFFLVKGDWIRKVSVVEFHFEI